MTTERDIRNQKAFARKEGLAEGLEKGLEKGLRKGRAEGMSEGKAEGKNEVARAMLQEKMPVETISRLTGLSAEQIQAL